MPPPTHPDSALEILIVPPTRDLGAGFEVRRALPSPKRRMVGPFVFLDQMGPAAFRGGQGLDVRPHPHIGLATVTYLFRGEILHRDSLGTVQAIRPGEVNWMTAGSGIVHSERTAPEERQHDSTLFGMQSWVALPKTYEEADPGFAHFDADELPLIEGEGAQVRLIAGELYGDRSPASVFSPMFYVEAILQPGRRLEFPEDYDERAVYVAEGELDLGADGRFAEGRLVVLRPGKPVMLRASSAAAARLMLLGGEPLDGPRYVWWNFVSSSRERIKQASEEWRAGSFPDVPGDPEFIPLPDAPVPSVSYP